MFTPHRFSLFLFFIVCLGCSSSEIDTDRNPFKDSIKDLSAEYLLVFGDIQEYTKNSNTMIYYDKSVNWIIRQLNDDVKITAILQVGDVTTANKESQWKLFQSSTQLLADRIPYFLCTGNHDYDWSDGGYKIAHRNSTLINKYADFSLLRQRVVAYYDGSSLENYVAEIDILDNKLYLLVLEFGARPQVLEWAKSFVQCHENDTFLLMTHEWLTRRGERLSNGSFSESQFKGYSEFCTPEQIWEELVYPNDNIWCVLCGHNGFSTQLYSENIIGRGVPQVLFNLQYQDNGGDGLVQLWEFNKNGIVNVGVYDTINERWLQTEETSFSLYK